MNIRNYIFIETLIIYILYLFLLANLEPVIIITSNKSIKRQKNLLNIFNIIYNKKYRLLNIIGLAKSKNRKKTKLFYIALALYIMNYFSSKISTLLRI